MSAVFSIHKYDPIALESLIAKKESVVMAQQLVNVTARNCRSASKKFHIESLYIYIFL